nr:D-alanyl-D-alanine carboxypeptidase [Planosporangium thailandense]
MTFVLAVVTILAVLGVLAGLQLSRPVPPAALRLSVPASITLPGPAPDLPWPAQGQGRLDVDGLGTLGSSGYGKPVPIGSVAKVMTAYLVLTDHAIGPGQPGPAITITAADEADYRARATSDESLVEVAAGEQLTERQALEALMLPSANNIAQILAAWDAGSVDAFVAKMNATAAELGLTGTHYTDPSGLAPTTVSTASDQTLLAQRALRIPAFAEIVALPSTTLPVAGTVRNYNSLLGTDGVFGVKTGSTTEAGGNLVFAAHLAVGGRTVTLVGAVLGQPGAATPQQLAAAGDATRKLLEAARRLVQVYTVAPAGQVGELRGDWGSSVPVRTAAPVQVVGWAGRTVTIDERPVEWGGAVPAGQRVGTLAVHDAADDTAVDVQTGSALPGPSLWWRLTRTP